MIKIIMGLKGSGKTKRLVDMVREAVPGAEVHSAKAGCTITSHCGPKTLGVLFLKK